MRLYLVRHARAEGLESLCYGRGEICVSPNATAAAADAVRKQLPQSVLAAAPVYSSPLSRCRERLRSRPAAPCTPPRPSQS